MRKIHKVFLSTGLTLTLALGGCGAAIPAYAVTAHVTPHVTTKVTTSPKTSTSAKSISPKRYNKIFGFNMNNHQKMCAKYGFVESCNRINKCPRIGYIDKSNPRMFHSSGCIIYPWWVVVGNNDDDNKDNK